jgi:hypothetical protein
MVVGAGFPRKVSGNSGEPRYFFNIDFCEHQDQAYPLCSPHLKIVKRCTVADQRGKPNVSAQSSMKL